ncbi:hypothetical protein BC830DRAFT_1173955 [Chytriomyces sp. MP71]|nr:hypothetical protein BC830DRAFT_1173955 [Chytriomyces sp. MP71]
MAVSKKPTEAEPNMLPETTTDYVGFNPAALFICFRESLEAVITVTVMLQFLQKTLADTEPLAVDLSSQSGS